MLEGRRQGKGRGRGDSGLAEGRGTGNEGGERGASGSEVGGGVVGECIRALDGMLITSCKVYYCRLFNVCLGMFLRMCGSVF